MKIALSASRLTLAAAALALSCSAYAAADVEAAKALAKQHACTKCHSLEKEKEGPSFKKIAAKYKGKADAEAKLVNHLTTGPKIKLEDGTEDTHKVLKADPAQVKNLVAYILEQQ